MNRSHIVSFFALITFTASLAIAQTPVPVLKRVAPGEPPAMKRSDADEAKAPNVQGTIMMPKVFFVEPKDGATVKTDVTLKFGIEGMKVSKAGDMTPGTGHHHLVIDGKPIEKGELVPTDDQHRHFGLGQTEAKITLPKGEHTLTLQFADGSHLSYGPALSQTIKVTVK
jgi:hypothetical protein